MGPQLAELLVRAREQALAVRGMVADLVGTLEQVCLIAGVAGAFSCLFKKLKLLSKAELLVVEAIDVGFQLVNDVAATMHQPSGGSCLLCRF